MTGTTTGDPSGDISRIYRSAGGPANTVPNAPGNLASSLVGDRVTFSWSGASDGQTPAGGLSYNLRVGTTPGGGDICSGMANAANGYRRVVRLGNAQKRTSWTMKVPPAGDYYWSVQAVDGAYAGSAFGNAVLGVEGGLPSKLSFALEGANPTTSASRFQFSLPDRARVELSVHDVAGRLVAELVNAELAAGTYTASWGSDEPGSSRQAGVYFASLKVGARMLTSRVVILK